MAHLNNITPEQRAEMQEKSRLARQAKKEAAKSLKTEYIDDPAWLDMAKKYGVRLPNLTSPASEVKYIKRLMKKLGIDYKDWLEEEGYKRLVDFSKDNPEWTARAHCGLILEWYNEKMEASV